VNVKDSLMAVTILIYLGLLAYVYKYRKNKGVQTRSPNLIILGGVGKCFKIKTLALLFDSIVNFFIALS